MTPSRSRLYGAPRAYVFRGPHRKGQKRPVIGYEAELRTHAAGRQPRTRSEIPELEAVADVAGADPEDAGLAVDPGYRRKLVNVARGKEGAINLNDRKHYIPDIKLGAGREARTRP